MTDHKDQRHLANKFATDWHLDVHDRQNLPDGSLNGAMVCEEIISIVEKEGWYPDHWRPEMDFHGGLIEKLNHDSCRIHWKAESGVMRYDLVDVEEFDSIDDGVLSYAKRFFGSDFDGIELKWI